MTTTAAILNIRNRDRPIQQPSFKRTLSTKLFFTKRRTLLGLRTHKRHFSTLTNAKAWLALKRAALFLCPRSTPCRESFTKSENKAIRTKAISPLGRQPHSRLTHSHLRVSNQRNKHMDHPPVMIRQHMAPLLIVNHSNERYLQFSS